MAIRMESPPRTPILLLVDVFDDEELFAWLDQAELAAGDVFDGGRIFTEAARVLAQPGVVRARAGERVLEGPILRPRFQHCQESAIADERVDGDHHAEGQENVLEHATTAAARRRKR